MEVKRAKKFVKASAESSAGAVIKKSFTKAVHFLGFNFLCFRFLRFPILLEPTSEFDLIKDDLWTLFLDYSR
jgi:hypothetical protein